MAIWNTCTGCYLECHRNFIFLPFTDPVLYSNVSDSFARARLIFLKGLGYLFFLGLRLLFRVISNMLCTCISQAVAHIHNPTFFSLHYILLHVYHSSAPSHKVLRTMHSRTRSRDHCDKAKETNRQVRIQRLCLRRSLRHRSASARLVRQLTS